MRQRLSGWAYGLMLLVMSALGTQAVAHAGTIVLVGQVVGSGSDEPDNTHAMTYSGYYTVTFVYTVATKKNGSGDFVFDPAGVSTVTITETAKFGGFTTLPVKITSADVSPGDGAVTGLKFASTDWYPNAALENITNNGLSGTVDLVQMTSSLISSYKDSSTGSVYTYIFATSPEPPGWALTVTGVVLVGLYGLHLRKRQNRAAPPSPLLLRRKVFTCNNLEKSTLLNSSK